MGLKIKNYKTILVSMVDYVSRKSKRLLDFSEGSVIRTIFEAIALELEEYYFKTYNNMVESIEESVYSAFGFERLPAKGSSGIVTITFANAMSEDVLLSKGTRFITGFNNENSLIFETKKDYTVIAGSVEAEVMVYCTKTGEDTNILAGSIVSMLNPVSSVISVTNKDSFTDGRDEETNEERQQRFNEYVETRSKGTSSAIEYGTKEVEGVTGVWVDESQTGIIRVYAHNSQGNLPPELKQAIIDNLYYYRPAGTPLFVNQISKFELNVEIELTVLASYASEEFKSYIKGKIDEYLNKYTVSEDFYSSSLNNFIRNIDRFAIKNCVIKEPLGDLEIENSQLIRSGDINVVFKEV